MEPPWQPLPSSSPNFLHHIQLSIAHSALKMNPLIRSVPCGALTSKSFISEHISPLGNTWDPNHNSYKLQNFFVFSYFWKLEIWDEGLWKCAQVRIHIPVHRFLCPQMEGRKQVSGVFSVSALTNSNPEVKHLGPKHFPMVSPQYCEFKVRNDQTITNTNSVCKYSTSWPIFKIPVS